MQPSPRSDFRAFLSPRRDLCPQHSYPWSFPLAANLEQPESTLSVHSLVLDQWAGTIQHVSRVTGFFLSRVHLRCSRNRHSLLPSKVPPCGSTKSGLSVNQRWTCGWSPLFGCCGSGCHEHSCTGLSVHTCVHCSGHTPGSGLAGSWGRSVFSHLRNSWTPFPSDWTPACISRAQGSVFSAPSPPCCHPTASSWPSWWL